jgi:hypothetical protein
MQGNRATASIARRFVAGADAAQAMRVAHDPSRPGSGLRSISASM